MYPSAEYHRSVRLTEGLYFYVWQGQGNNCNTAFFPGALRGPRPHIMVDPGLVTDSLGEPCLGSLTAAIDKDGFKLEEVGLIIITHSHPDHCAASRPVAEKTRRDEAGHVEEALIALAEEERLLVERFGRTMQFEPDFYLQEGELQLGGPNGLKLQVLHTPGHSPGSISLYYPDARALICGDVVFYGSVGRTDLAGGSLVQLRQSIARLAALEVEYLLPGHSTQYGGMIAGADLVRRNFQGVQFLL